MSELKAENLIALQFLVTEDIYLIDAIDKPIPNPVVSVTEEPKQELSETMSFDYLGENNKYFVLLVNYPDQTFMPAKELEALQSILGAKKMELKDVALVNLHKYTGATFHQLKTFFVCNKIVLFGINPQQLQLPAITSNQITEHNGVKILGTFGFSEMMSNVDKKKLFWNVMKGF